MSGEPGDVYLPLSDDVLTYDCAECGYQCCRGFGTSLLEGSESDALLELRPELRPFLVGSSDLVTFSPACFLLQENGNCELEEKRGRELKPWICRLYPFTSITKLGTVYTFNFNVIGQNTICPFKLNDRPGRGITRASVVRDLTGWNAPDHAIRRAARTAPQWDLHAPELIATERATLEALGELPRDASTLEALSCATGLSTSGVRARLAHHTKVLGLPEARESPGQPRVLAAGLPSVRLAYFTGLPEQGWEAAVRNLPDYLCLVSLYSSLAAQAARRPLTVDLLLKVAAKMRNFLYLASLLEKKVEFVKSVREKREVLDASLRAPQMRVLVYLLQRHAGPRALWELLCLASEKSGTTAADAAPLLGAFVQLAPYLCERPAEPVSEKLPPPALQARAQPRLQEH